MVRYGASPEDWAHFDLILGLGADLLPVVSNPNAKVSPNSKLKALGKVPSRYNGGGAVAGIAKWTEHRATGAEIERWAAEPDYGICLQTREVRALDIDVDSPLAYEIALFVGSHCGVNFPVRMRDNSMKSLLAFRMPGEFSKRVLKVDGGIIEFLATGQQFIAAGTHTSGERYRWVWPSDEESIPEIGEPEFLGLWDALVKTFGIEAPTTAGGLRRNAPALAVADHTIEHLDVLGWGKEGEAIIRCPFEDGHSTGEAGDTSTVYFPAGTRGYEQGHFKCLHGSCTGRPDEDFLDALGLRLKDFDDIVVAEELREQPWPNFKRDTKSRIESTVGNLEMALLRPDVCGADIRFDTFRDEIILLQGPETRWRAFHDEDYVRLRIHLERLGFKPISREMMRDVVLVAARSRKFDSGVAWLDGLVWDGVPRVEAFCTKYLGVEDSPYAQAVSRYVWTALAGRMLSPGVKADMVPILVGPQGKRKSSAVEAMALGPELFVEISLNERDDDLSRKLRGVNVVEISELRGLNSNREMEAVKAFVTRTHERWIPKYQEFASVFPRRCVFIGTTNEREFLADTTGNRRWLPVDVAMCDTDAIVRDREQLWAEGKERFLVLGVEHQAAEILAQNVHENYTLRDPWEDAIRAWLDRENLDGLRPRDMGDISTHMVMEEALGFSVMNTRGNEARRIGKILRVCGFQHKKLHSRWGWLPCTPT